MREAGCLDRTITNREARAHLVESFKGIQSPAFNGYMYKYRSGDGCKELEWARKRGIGLRGFMLSYDGDVRSGYVPGRLMGGSIDDFDEDEPNLDVAKYYAMRGKLTHTALTWACEKGYLKMVKCLLAAGADKDKANNDGNTPLIRAAREGRVEMVQLLLSAGADKDKADSYGYTPWIGAAIWGHVETVQLLPAAGAKKGNVTSNDETALSFATSEGHQEIVLLLQSAGQQP